MKYKTVRRSYNPSDCTTSGWETEFRPGRVRLTKRSRWQGSRDGAIFLKDIPERESISQERAEELESELKAMLRCGWGELHYAKGSEFRGWRCQSAGYIVR